MSQLPDIHNWNEDFLLSLPVAEASYLEFKESLWLIRPESDWREQISKYLSAFANGDGGYLIVGVPDPEAGIVAPDGGVPNILKGGIVQWLQNILPGLVERPLDRIDVWPIGPKEEGQSGIKADHSVLVIHVPASEGAPHQARDNRYYTRHGSHLHSLGHRAIMDIVGRRKHPTVKLGKVRLLESKVGVEFSLSAVVENTSTKLARFFSVVLEIPARVGQTGVLTDSDGGGTIIDRDGCLAVRVNLHSGINSRLYRLSTVTLRATLYVRFLAPELNEKQTSKDVRFKLFADDMPFVEGTIPFPKVIKRE